MAAMGKGHKPSRGSSSSFLPDYKIETMGESNDATVLHLPWKTDSGGVGSSGGIDADWTTSEDSSAPMRKSMSLNVDTSDAFGVPLQIFSLSNMSRSQLKELEKKFRIALDQVRVFQRKVASSCVNGVAVSSSSDVRSFKYGVEKAQSSIGMPSVSANGKVKPKNKDHSDLFKLASSKDGKHHRSKNGGQLKRGPSGRFETLDAGANKAKHKDNLMMEQCGKLLDSLMAHQYAWVFNTPVDVVKLNISDYFHIIKHPMDLGTVKSNLASGTYSSRHAFAADVRLTFSNAKTYNPPSNDVHIMADVLSNFFEARWKVTEKKMSTKATQSNTKKDTFPLTASEPIVTEKNRKVDGLHQNKRKISEVKDMVKTETEKRIMSEDEKVKLSMDLENLAADAMEHVIEFLRQHSENTNPNDEDEIEIDIDSLSHDVLFSLRKLLDEHMKKKQTHQEKSPLIEVNSDEVEILCEYGLSSSLLQPSKEGTELVDEDVDIGGNEPPASSYPPIEIEKDMVPCNSKCTSSRSCDSDSNGIQTIVGAKAIAAVPSVPGQDLINIQISDSISLDGSDSKRDRAASPSAAYAKETLYSGPPLDHLKSGKLQTNNGSCLVNELEEREYESQTKTASCGADSQDLGENVPPEPQVSPQKLYRAALLRSRFADTILKACEKTRGQGEKGDLDKLRHEKEELERQQREEKAHIEAEAKAAENAQRQAEAVVAEELKEKREVESEAARLALQKMEKTVEIDENSQLLKHLEMFQSAPLPDQFPCSVTETSPDPCGEGMSAGFKLGGSNPLEQLGLYRKDEDEDEDDGLLYAGVTTTNFPAADDVEEGEID